MKSMQSATVKFDTSPARDRPGLPDYRGKGYEKRALALIMAMCVDPDTRLYGDAPIDEVRWRFTEEEIEDPDAEVRNTADFLQDAGFDMDAGLMACAYSVNPAHPQPVKPKERTAPAEIAITSSETMSLTAARKALNDHKEVKHFKDMQVLAAVIESHETPTPQMIAILRGALSHRFWQVRKRALKQLIAWAQAGYIGERARDGIARTLCVRSSQDTHRTMRPLLGQAEDYFSIKNVASEIIEARAALGPLIASLRRQYQYSGMLVKREYIIDTLLHLRLGALDLTDARQRIESCIGYRPLTDAWLALAQGKKPTGGTAQADAGVQVGWHRGRQSMHSNILDTLYRSIGYLARHDRITDAVRIERFKEWYEWGGHGSDAQSISEVPDYAMFDIDTLASQTLPADDGSDLHVVYLPETNFGHAGTRPIKAHIGLRKRIIWVAAGIQPNLSEKERILSGIDIRLATIHEAEEYNIATNANFIADNVETPGLLERLLSEDGRTVNVEALAIWRDEASPEAQEYFHLVHVEACKKVHETSLTTEHLETWGEEPLPEFGGKTYSEVMSGRAEEFYDIAQKIEFKVVEDPIGGIAQTATEPPTAQPRRTTPLHTWHQQQGANMANFGGWSMPRTYPSRPGDETFRRPAMAEHDAVRNGVGLFDTCHMGVLEISGGDRAFNFLQRVTTGDLHELQTGGIQYSYILDDDGRIIDDITVYRLEDRFMLVVNAANTERVNDWLAQQNREGATITDMNRRDRTVGEAGRVMVAIQGPRAVNVLQHMEPSAEINLETMEYFTVQSAVLGGIEVLISRTGYTREDGFEVFVHPDRVAELWERILVAGTEEQIRPCGLMARDSLRLEGLPLHGHELAGLLNINPFEAGYGWTVAFNKFDTAGNDVTYVGEAAMRRARDNVERRVVNLVVLGREGEAVDVTKMVPMPRSRAGGEEPSKVYVRGDGDWELLDERTYGITSDGLLSPTWHQQLGGNVTLAMACLPRQHARRGTIVQIETRGKKYNAVVLPHNFYNRAGGAEPALDMARFVEDLKVREAIRKTASDVARAKATLNNIYAPPAHHTRALETVTTAYEDPTDEVIRIVIAALTNPNAEIRLQAATTLGKWARSDKFGRGALMDLRVLRALNITLGQEIDSHVRSVISKVIVRSFSKEAYREEIESAPMPGGDKQFETLLYEATRRFPRPQDAALCEAMEATLSHLHAGIIDAEDARQRLTHLLNASGAQIPARELDRWIDAVVHPEDYVADSGTRDIARTMAGGASYAELQEAWATTFVNSVSAQADALRKQDKKLCLLVDTSIANLENHARDSLIATLEAMARQKGFDLLYNHDAGVLAGEANRYLREHPNAEIRGVIHTNAQRQYTTRFSGKAELEERIKLVAVNDEQVAGSLHHVPLLPIIVSSITGETEDIPGTEHKPGDGGIIVSIRDLLPAATPLTIDGDLKDLYREDARFVASA
jgi:aminomethyltransferase